MPDLSLWSTPKQKKEITAPSGVHYYVDVSAHWDGLPGGAVRVIGTIDDGGLRAFVPMTDDFIKASDGSFVGEESP